MSGSQNSENSKDSFVSNSRFNTLYPPFKRHKHWNECDLYWTTPSSKSAWGDTYARMSSGNGRSSPDVNQEHISNVGSVDLQVEESQLPADQYSPMYVCLFSIIIQHLIMISFLQCTQHLKLHQYQF